MNRKERGGKDEQESGNPSIGVPAAREGERGDEERN